MDDASLLQTKLTQAQVDELGQRLAEADVAFGSVKPAAGGEFSGGGGRNLVSYGNRAAAAVWLARDKGSKSAAIAACRADQSAKQVGGNCALVDKRIEQHEAATVKAARDYLRTNPAPPTMAPPPPAPPISVARACIAVPSWLVQGLANPESVLAHWCAFPAACLTATGPRGGTPVDTNICGVLGASSGQCGGGDNGVGRASVERYGLRSVRHAPCTGRRTDVGFCDLGVHVRTVG